MKNRFYYLLFPKKCVSCAQIISPDKYYCENCESKMPYISSERCEECGMSKKDCSHAKIKKYYDGIYAPFYYEGGAKNGILRLKRYPVYAEAFAAECEKVFNGYLQDKSIDFVCAVPMGKHRFRESGYNHSAALGEEISKRINLPFENVLGILYEPHSQHSLPSSFRGGNVRGIYDIICPEEKIKGKNILLVDDIKTSGATLNECALILKLYGANSVYALTAAVSRKGK